MSSTAPSERSPAPGGEAEGGEDGDDAAQDDPMDGIGTDRPSEAEDAAQGSGGEQGEDSGPESGIERERGGDARANDGSGQDNDAAQV